MPAHSTARSASPPAKRSLLSYVKAPFGGKARHFSDFFIQPDDPHRVYGPGDIVTGSVILKVTKPFSVTHITVRLHGYAQVYKAPNSPGEAQRQYNTAITAAKSRKTAGYHGNGFISLFEDEITLCGDGRLGEGTYQFGFELVFPRESLPSSIDFEKGTVSYLVTSTMTRPTTISPTSVCERKVNFQEDIDVAALSLPKPRVITLEPLVRRSKTKRPKPRSSEPTEEAPTGGSVDGSSADTATHFRANGSQTDMDPPHSPVTSDISFESCISSGGTGSVADSAAPSARTCESKLTNDRSHVCSHKQRPIVATIELPKSGFLAGYQIPVKVFLKHTKPIKSLRGVIVTLYRQARVDMHPTLPMLRNGVDDANPRSRSGISGFSLSSGGSTHTYRKDLDQQFASLIVNPNTLTAEVKATLRIPEDVFSSITTVPGAMLSFKYYIETIIDIQGRLASLDKYLPSAVPPSNIYTYSRPDETNVSTFAPWGGHFINTEDVRREKGVVYSVTEIVVGTRDSERKSNWRQAETDGGTITGREDGRPATTDASSLTNGSMNHSEHEGSPLSWDQYWRHHPPGQPPDAQPPPAEIYPPPSDFGSEQHLSEKERAQRAEARLLPSAPPGLQHPQIESSIHAATAPMFFEERTLPSRPPPEFDAGFASSSSHYNPTFNDHGSEDTSAPAYDLSERPSIPMVDDKEAMRRQRLEMERSAPDDTREHDVENAQDPVSILPSFLASSSAASAPAAETFTPSAPTAHDLSEHEQFGFPGRLSQQFLPRYER